MDNANSQLFYRDLDSGLVNVIGQDGSPNILDTTRTYKSVKWASSTFGIAMGSDNQLYAINSGSVQPISLPASISQGQAVDYSVSSDKKVYVSVGSQVYVGTGAANFKILLKAKSDNPQLYAGNNGRLAIIDTVGAPDASTGSSTVVTVISSTSSKTSQNIDSREISWSPDGKYLAVRGYVNNGIYTASLEQVAKIPQKDIKSVAWLDSKTLLYGANNSIWSYKLSSGRAETIANVSTGSSISSIYISDNGGSAYIVSKGASSTGGGLSRVRFADVAGPTSKYGRNLGIFFPSNTAQCSFTFTNFLRPVLLVTSWTNTETCTDAAQEELKSDGLPVSGFSIIFNDLSSAT